MTDRIVTPSSALVKRFPQAVTQDEREGYSGFQIDANKLVEVATALRDEMDYDYLTSITSVDYIEENLMEVVYHFYRSTGGTNLTLSIRVSRDDPIVPSLYYVFPGADFQEREVWDLMGIKFEGHPDLRRLLLWEGFAGHPLRKDWKEPFFNEERKPFTNRWPEGHVFRIEDENPFGKNVQYPHDFTDPEKWSPQSEDLLYAGLLDFQVSGKKDLKTDMVVVNLGPQHPSTHGVFRMAVVLNGETIVALKPVVGYLHRNHEKIGERNTYLHNMPFTDRLDYLCSMSNNFGYALAVEKLIGDRLVVPERAEYLRVIMAELTRIVNHVWTIGFILNDLGAFFTPMLYALEERELILDIFEATAGSRMMCNYFRFGGVSRDMPEDVFKKLTELVNERLPRKIDELDIYLTENEIIAGRCEGVGIYTPEDAIAFGSSGPLLRASGVPYDIRRAEPYGIYDRFDFDVAVRYHGDTFDRFIIRMDEIRQSLRILQQAVKDIPDGPVITKNPYNIRVPVGESYGRVESPKGELGFYLVSDGTSNPYRYHVRAPSLINLTCLEKICVGQKIADVVVILGSIDIVLGECDR
ncbi:MAG: NADH-quinone oxidoreductase subunit C [Anaerolineales bacterium]|jgi:NADH-quinone oxidoreductase subunit D/NADH-quinone oxidoreductase subunit C/D